MRVEARPYHRRWPAEVCTFASESRDSLIERLRQFASVIRTTPRLHLKDLAYTLNVSEPSPCSAYRLAFVASTLEEASERVSSALDRLSRPDCKRIRDPRGIFYLEHSGNAKGGVAFLFPGEGSQYAGMLSELCLFFPQVRTWFDLMDRAFVDHPRGCTPSQLVFPLPGKPDGEDSRPDRLWQTDGAVEAVFTASQGMLALLQSLQIYPDAVVGHSAGDYSALFASGAFQIESDLQFIQQARKLNCVYEEFAASGGVPKGVLLAVNSADPFLLASVVAQSNGNLHLALDNCPHQVVFCGAEECAQNAAEAFRNAGAICEFLPFARAYHTPLFAPVSERLFELLEKFDLRAPVVPAYSCVTADLYPSDTKEIQKLAAAQWSQPVRFRETVERMYRAGIRTFVEVGPASNLTAFVEDILRGRSCLTVPSDIAGRSGMVQIQYLVAQLFVAGVPMQLDELYARREPRKISLDPAEEPSPSPTSGVPLCLRLPGLHLSSRSGGDTYEKPKNSSLPVNLQRPEVNAAIPPLAAAPDSRTEAMEGFFQNTLKMLEVEREVMTRFLASQRSDCDLPLPDKIAASPQPVVSTEVNPKLPFVRKIVSLIPGCEAKVVCEIDLREDLFLTDHTLAGRIASVDEKLIGLPVVPLTVTMEMLAEVASLLAPGLLVVEMKDLQASRWLVVEQERLALEITARRNGEGNEIEVELRESPGNETGNTRNIQPAAVATVVVAKSYFRSPESFPLVLDDECATKWQAGKMYAGTGMFHGPLFQVVSSMDLTGKNGAQATFTGCSNEGFFRTKVGEQLIDPVTLDAMGQVIGYWTGDHFETGLSVFPFRLAKLEIFRSPLRPGENALCRARVHFVDDDWIRSDIEVAGVDNCVIFRMSGWEDRRLDLPRRFYDFRISPANVLLSDRWPAPLKLLPEPQNFRCTVLKRFPEEILESHGSIWLMVLAYMVLNENERHVWRGLKSANARRIEWLLGRIAAKDAVRLLLRDTLGLDFFPADIEIGADPAGAPVVKGEWTKNLPSVPVVSISHTNALAIAIAGQSSEYSSVGVDIEHIGRINGHVERLVLSVGERELLGTLDEAARAQWTTRLWCAKEAVGKALGRGLLGSPSQLQVRHLDVPTGRVETSVPDDIGYSRSRSRGSSVIAYTGDDGEHAFGTALL